MQQSCSEITLHSESYGFTTERSDCCASFGTIYPKIVFLEMFVKLISHSWVEVILLPSGMTMLIGFLCRLYVCDVGHDGKEIVCCTRI